MPVTAMAVVVAEHTTVGRAEDEAGSSRVDGRNLGAVDSVNHGIG